MWVRSCCANPVSGEVRACRWVPPHKSKNAAVLLKTKRCARKLVDMRYAFHPKRCPAVECRQERLRQITADDLPAIHAKLEGAANGRPYDYYHCNGWCKRIWRIERYDPSCEPYQEPEWIGYWDSCDGELFVYKRPQRIDLDWQFNVSKTDPTKPARNQRDARRNSRRRANATSGAAKTYNTLPLGARGQPATLLARGALHAPNSTPHDGLPYRTIHNPNVQVGGQLNRFRVVLVGPAMITCPFTLVRCP